MAITKLKQVAALAILFVILSAGGGIVAYQTLSGSEPEPSQHQPAPSVSFNPQAKAKTEPPVLTDRFGDPLPVGAISRLGTLRYRVPDEIVGLALAPDGKTMAVSSRAGVFLFETASGKRVQHHPASGLSSYPSNPISFSPDGKRLAGRGNIVVNDQVRGVIRVWQLAGQRKHHDYAVENALWVGWSEGGEPLAVCLEEGAVRLHELAAGRSRRFACAGLPRPHLYDHGMWSACMPSGQTLAVADEQRAAVHVWDIASGRERCLIQLDKGDNVTSLALSPDGSKLLCGIRAAVQMWDVATAKALYTVKSNGPYPFPVFSADGKLFAAQDSWHSVCFRDAATGRELGRTRDKCRFEENIAFTSDGKTLVAADYNKVTIHLFDVATGKRSSQADGHQCRPHGMTFSPDGRRVATGGSLDGTIFVWDLATGTSLFRIERSPKWVRYVAYSPDGRWLYSTWTDDNLWISDAATGERRHVIKLEDPDRPDTRQSAIDMKLSEDGKRLVAFSYYYAKKEPGPRYQDTLITGWDASTHKQLFRRRRPGIESWTALSPDARVLAVAHGAFSRQLVERVPPAVGPMRLEDVASGEDLLTIPALEGQTWPMAFSPDGRLLAANNYVYVGKRHVRTLRLWEIATAAEVLKLPAADNNRVAFSQDGCLLAVAAPSQEILVWDLARGRELRRFKGYEGEVTWLAFSLDGRRLVSGLNDSTLLVWDVGPRAAGPAIKLGAEGAAKAWTDLAGADAPQAFRARGALASSPEEAVTLLKERLRPARAADPQLLRKVLSDLDSATFAVRAKAQADLEALSDLAEPALRQALADPVTLEMRRRVQSILGRLHGPVRRPDMLRSLRAVAVLEDIATPAARKVLEELASGAPGVRLTREAQASLSRLDRRKGPTEDPR